MSDQKQRVRESLGKHSPELLALLDSARARFDAKLVHVKTPDLELGTPQPEGLPAGKFPKLEELR